MNKLPSYSLIGVLVCSVGMLVGSPAAQASEVSKLRVKIAKLEKENKALRARISTTRSVLKTAAVQLTTCYGERDSARAALSADTSARVAALPAGDLWGLLAVFKTRFDETGGSQYHATLFQGSSFSSYSFDSWSP